MPSPRSWTTTSTTCTLHRHSIDSEPPTSATSHSQSLPNARRLNEFRYPDAQPESSAADKPRIYPGSGTPEDPYIVDWDLNDPEDPYNWSKTRRWFITAQLALTTFTVSFGSSAYSGGLQDITRALNISDEIAILGISLYVLGFALGPLFFAPLGEMFGRRIIFLMTLSVYTLFQLQGALSKNLPTLLSCRLLTGIAGSSPLTNAGGAVSDIWNFRERGLASAIYATVPFLGPVIGPIVGGFVAENPHLGWHFNFWIMLIFSILTLIVGYFMAPETYAPVLLRRRAQKLQKASNNMICYTTSYDRNSSKSFLQIMCTNLKRPFVFVVTEPIVLLLAIYISIVYGTLYALFSAFPIIFQQHRGFTPGQSGLAFLGVGFGIITGTASQSIQNRIYWKSMDQSETGRAPPEARLHMAIVGGILAPIGLWWFAWTSMPNVHWIVSILAGIPFGVGVAQILQSLTAYLMDTYDIYFASAIAATVVLRSFCGAAFPLFSPSMFAGLGDQWAMSIFAILSTVCMPIPILFWKYGWWIRSKSRVAYKDTNLLPRQDTTGSIGASQLETKDEKEIDSQAEELPVHPDPLHYDQQPHQHRPSTDGSASMITPYPYPRPYPYVDSRPDAQMGTGAPSHCEGHNHDRHSHDVNEL
ncbi:MFS general substrate transporter [Macrolepiota fuliginosa MF-IS2]|uniref:MFS general substrate transporter n=1 Tax=Macrolepiota fuliginosa MF-IS2 TaxID=1400762 RepID=A0A9P5XIV8_9AGAR|nr:MFS general substrate transporter [Macrolepiota fuliginosa MF-IS2]